MLHHGFKIGVRGCRKLRPRLLPRLQSNPGFLRPLSPISRSLSQSTNGEGEAKKTKLSEEEKEEQEQLLASLPWGKQDPYLERYELAARRASEVYEIHRLSSVMEKDPLVIVDPAKFIPNMDRNMQLNDVASMRVPNQIGLLYEEEDEFLKGVKMVYENITKEFASQKYDPQDPEKRSSLKLNSLVRTRALLGKSGLYPHIQIRNVKAEVLACCPATQYKAPPSIDVLQSTPVTIRNIFDQRAESFVAIIWACILSSSKYKVEQVAVVRVTAEERIQLSTEPQTTSVVLNAGEDAPVQEGEFHECSHIMVLQTPTSFTFMDYWHHMRGVTGKKCPLSSRTDEEDIDFYKSFWGVEDDPVPKESKKAQPNAQDTNRGSKIKFPRSFDYIPAQFKGGPLQKDPETLRWDLLQLGSASAGLFSH